MLGNGAISWKSKLQSTVTASTMEAKYIRANEATREAIWIQQLLKELKQIFSTIPIQIDNQSCIALAKNPEYHARSKHIDIQHHFIREQVKKKNVELFYCSTKEMIADIFTKPLAKKKLEKFKNMMGLVSK